MKIHIDIDTEKEATVAEFGDVITQEAFEELLYKVPRVFAVFYADMIYEMSSCNDQDVAMAWFDQVGKDFPNIARLRYLDKDAKRKIVRKEEYNAGL